MGLMAREGRAETITMTIVTNGHTINITGALVTSQTSTDFQVNTTALNATLIADGSAYRFSSLGASSDWPGTTGSTGGSLQTNGGLFIPTTASGVLGAITIATSEDGFTAPTGPNGSMITTVVGNANDVPAGSTGSYMAAFNGVNEPALTGTSTGTQGNTFSLSRTDALGAVAAPYTVSSTWTFNMTQNTTAQAQLGFSGGGQVSQTAVPEPASLVLMLTGMPLPLVVIALLRRRRGAA
jgi:hypothetical protein